MKILIVHLSDMHVRGESDLVLGQVEEIVDAVRNVDYSLDLAVAVFSGDLSHSGSEDQFAQLTSFIRDLQRRMGAALNHRDSGSAVPVEIVMVPGNHDCEFGESEQAREIVVAQIPSNLSQARDSSVVNLCLAVQRNFFDFRDSLGGMTPNKVGDYDPRLCYEYRIQLADESVRFLCCNTAWISRLNEEQGKLAFPSDAIISMSTNDILSVAVMHHPYNWLEADSARSFRRNLEKTVDLILTGHEHDATFRTQQGHSGERNQYIEGGALQDGDEPLSSSFNAIVIDTDTKHQKLVELCWNGDRFAPAVQQNRAGDEGYGLSWEPYQVNRLRMENRFEPNVKTLNYMNDPGVALTHRGASKLNLRDIFVFPDLREITLPVPGVVRTVKGEGVIDLVSQSQQLLVTGDNQSGKTSLAKMLFLELHGRGDVPILVDGLLRPPRGDRLYGHFESLFSEQYDVASLGAYQQLDRNLRIIIVDDYDQLPGPAATKRELVNAASRFAGKVVLLAHDLSMAVSDLVEPGESAETSTHFSHFRILPFGHLRRDELIQKWLLLGAEESLEGPQLAHRMASVTGTIDTLIGRNFVPAFPVYVLAVLQASESATAIDTSASTHGYFYELFIRNALAKGQSQVEFDVSAAYLSFVAYQLFCSKQREVSESDYRRIHQDYEALYDISLSCNELKRRLISQQILEEFGGYIRFKHNYAYYYFVAAYMRDHIGKHNVRTQIAELSRSLYVQEHSNILLFLAHVSKDPVILQEMMAASKELYSQQPEAEIGEDASFLLRLGGSQDSPVYEETDPEAKRREMLERLDQKDEVLDGRAGPVEEREATDQVTPVAELNAALKNLQILGQILKNFPGSLEGERKLETLRACYGLGRRTIAEIFGLLKANEAELVRDLMEVLKEDHPQFETAELAKRARHAIIGLAYGVSFGLVHRVSSAVGSPELATTYKRLLKEDSSPAVKLINASIELDHSGGFPAKSVRSLARELSKNHVARSILQQLVIHHFDLFPVPYNVKQSACEALDISYVQARRPKKTRKLIADVASKAD